MANSITQSAGTFTWLHCMPGHFAAKKFVREPSGRVRKEDFNAGHYFYPFELEVHNIEELSEVLTFLETAPGALVIRGAPVTTSEPLRRTGAGDGATFKSNFKTPSIGRRWVLIDIDKMVLPQGLVLSKRALPKVIDWVASQLPPELQATSFHWQLSSSAGVYDKTRVSVHLWFWLSHPVADRALKDWATAFNDGSSALKIDTALFQQVQPHYTSKPIFDGMPDPFPIRSGMFIGAKDAATIKQPTNKPCGRSQRSVSATSLSQAVAVSGFDAIVASIGDHPGGSGFKGPLLRASASYVATNGAKNTDPEALYEQLRTAVLQADASKHTTEDIVERASREVILPMIKSALRKFGHIKSIGSPNLIQGLAPTCRPSKTLASKEALKTEIDSFFSF